MSVLYEFDPEKGDIDEDVFDALSNDLVLFMFSAPWCGPCRRLTPFVQNMAAETPDVRFYKIDVERFQVASEQFNITVMPTFVFLYKGKIAHVMEGGTETKLRAGIGILQKMQSEQVVI